MASKQGCPYLIQSRRCAPRHRGCERPAFSPSRTHTSPMLKRTSIGVDLLVAAGLWASATVALAQAGVDTAIQPGDDFFAYANGGWLHSAEIPAGKERWDARRENAERAQRQGASPLDDGAGAPAGSHARKGADFRAAH